MQRHFDPDTARMLDTLIEGMTIHRALDDHPRDAREVRVAVARIASRSRSVNATRRSSRPTPRESWLSAEEFTGCLSSSCWSRIADGPRSSRARPVQTSASQMLR